MDLKTPKARLTASQSHPTSIPEAVDLLKAAGFKEERDSPASGALRYDFPTPDPRYILVSTAWGGCWPEKEEDGISAGLYDPTHGDAPVEDIPGVGDGFAVLPTARVIPNLLVTVERWLASREADPSVEPKSPVGLRNALQAPSSPTLPKGWETLGIAGLPLFGKDSGWSWSIRTQLPGNVFEWRDRPDAKLTPPAEALARREEALAAFREAGFCTVSLGTAHAPVHEQAILAFLPEELEMLGPALAEQFVVGWGHGMSLATRDREGQLTLFGLTGTETRQRQPLGDAPKSLEITSGDRVFRYEWDQARFEEKAETACHLVDGNFGGWVLQGMPDVLDAKVHQMLQGRQVVMSDAQFDAIVALDSPWTDQPWLNRFATMPNPSQVGVLDRWVGFIKPRRG